MARGLWGWRRWARLRLRLRRGRHGFFDAVGCAGVATGSILVYAYILMYYIKDRGFRGSGYLKAEGERISR